jgi:TRAP-type C4-dicarboxylate transport system permease small subunit
MVTNAEDNLLTKIKKAFELFCGLLLFIAITISMAEIVTRVFTGLLLPEGGHISIDFLRNKFTGKLRWLLEVTLALITLAYGVFITWGSILFLQQLYARQSIFPRYLPIPKWIVELCVPLSMAIFTIFAFAGLVKVIRQKW